MRSLLTVRRWIDSFLRARRFAGAQRPSHPVPSWIRQAESFSVLHSNPMAHIPAAKIAWLEQAGTASRLLSRYANELQQAANSLEDSRAALLANNTPGFSDMPQFGAIERQRRALSLEREAICLLAWALRERYSREFPLPGIDEPRALLGGLTTLAYFVSIRRLDAVELLIQAGASPDAQCTGGISAVSLASRKAEALAGAPHCGAALDASCILALLEERSFNLHVMQSSGPAGTSDSAPRSRL